MSNLTSPTCGVVLDLNPQVHLCGDPAFFRYSGLVPLKHNESHAIAIRLRGRIVVDMCMEHSRQTFIRMEPSLKDKTATMRCLVQTRLTIRCVECNSLFRFEPLAPTVHKAPGRFCPNCGAQSSSTTFEPTLDYWEIIAEQLNLPVGLTKTVHTHWLKDRTATAKFVEYIQEIQRELEADGH